MNTRRTSERLTVRCLTALVLSSAFALSGCGQSSGAAKPPTSYRGKPDPAPWNDTRWHGDRQAWERAIAAREQNQNDYVRIP